MIINSMRRRNYKSGYSMVDIVVYIGLLGVMIALIANSALSIYRLFGLARVERRLALEGGAALERMVRDIRAASATNVAESAFGINTGTLNIDNLKFFVSEDTLHRDNAGIIQNLTSGARVTNFVLYRDSVFATGTQSELITIQLTLEAGNGVLRRTKNFFASAVMRGGY